MIFEVFWEYLSEFLIFIHEVFFDSKILPSSLGKHENVDYESSSYTGNEKVPILDLFYDLGHCSSCL